MTTTLYVLADDDWASEPMCLVALRQELEQYVQDCVDDPDRRSAAIQGLKIADDPQTIEQAVDLVQSVNHSIQAGSNGLTIRAVESGRTSFALVRTSDE